MNRTWTRFALLGCVVFAVYLPYLDNPFVWDDEPLVVRNPLLRDPSRWDRLLTDQLHAFGVRGGNYWRPAAGLSLALDYLVWGPRPAGFRLTGVALHAVNSFLVSSLLIGLGASPPAAAVGAAFYAVNPAWSSVVGYVASRSDLLCAFFVLSGLWAALRRGWPGVLVPIGCYAGALASREAAVMFPLLLIWMGWVEKRRGLLAVAAACLAVAGAWWLARGAVVAAPVPPWAAATAGLRLPAVLLSYLGIFYFPVNPHLLRWLPPPPSPLAPGFLLPLFPLAVLVAAAVRFRSLRPGLGFFLIAVSPYLGFYPLAAPLADNWLYLPAAGLVLLAAPFWSAAARRRWPALAVVGVLGAGTVVQARFWSDPVALYLRTVSAAPPDSLREARGRRLGGVFGNLGDEYAARGEADRARRWFFRALRVDPENVAALDGQGRLLAREGEFRAAEAAYLRALALRPDQPETLSNLGRLWADLGLFAKAEAVVRRALAADPLLSEAWGNLALVQARTGDYGAALRSWRRAAALDPGISEYALNLERVGRLASSAPDPAREEKFFALGARREEAGDLPGARAAYREAFRHPAAALNLGRLCRAAGNPVGAIEAYRRALFLDGSLAEARVNLANVYTDMGFFAAAAAECRAAAAREPSPGVFNAWGRALGEGGDLKAAAEKWEKALELDPGFAPAARNLEKVRSLR